jgi:pseudaminic acid biosynthesis-associated methylase
MNEQEAFWINDIAEDYLTSNDSFDLEGSMTAWRKMLGGIGVSRVNSFLECGSNVGRNLHTLKQVLPGCDQGLIELSPAAFAVAVERYSPLYAYNGAIKNSAFPVKFDLVFSMGVLIHVNPEELVQTMTKMFEHSKRYILIGEYFNRTPVSIPYRGSQDKLFKRDFGRLFLENFDCKLVDYGFLWGYEFDDAGFDDITYWLFEKSH